MDRQSEFNKKFSILEAYVEKTNLDENEGGHFIYTATPLSSMIKDIHGLLSYQAIKISNNIFKKWREKEDIDQKGRTKVMRYLSWGLLIQLIVVVSIVFLIGRGRLEFENVERVIISLFTPIIVQLIGLMAIAVKYIYNERSTNTLKVVAELMRDAGANNLGHNNDSTDAEDIGVKSGKSVPTLDLEQNDKKSALSRTMIVLQNIILVGVIFINIVAVMMISKKNKNNGL